VAGETPAFFFFHKAGQMEVSKVDAAIDYAVAEIAKTDAAIEQIREEYLQLVVAGPQDQAGFKSAETALKKVVRIRTSVEKTRKALKADSVRYGKAVDSEAKRIKEAIEPIEEHLKTQCDVVRLEEARQKVAAENARRDEVNGWVAELSELGWPVDLPALQRMTPEEFGFLRLSAKKRHAEQAEEREAIAKERAALEAERLELEELRAEKAKREAATVNAEPEGSLSGFVTVSEAREADDSKEQLLLVCDALFYIKLPESLGKYRGRVKSILTEAIEEIRGLAE
jgi:hypothetical protein